MLVCSLFTFFYTPFMFYTLALIHIIYDPLATRSFSHMLRSHSLEPIINPFLRQLDCRAVSGYRPPDNC